MGDMTSMTFRCQLYRMIFFFLDQFDYQVLGVFMGHGYNLLTDWNMLKYLNFGLKYLSGPFPISFCLYIKYVANISHPISMDPAFWS